MIGFLRLIGVLNAAVWFGAAVFFAFGAGPGTSSEEMKALLGPKNYPYFSVAIEHIIASRFFHLQLACSLVAILHLFAGWLYFGKIPQRIWLGLLAGLIAANLVGGLGLEPRLKTLNTLRYAVNATPENRAAADRSFRTWQTISEVVNLMVVAGLAVYVWRVANPADQTRFVSAVKFRG